MSLKLLAVFALTEFLLSLTPGPAVLLVISQSIRNGLRSSTASVLGILTANAFYFVLSAVGLGALLVASATLFEFIRWIGMAYLIFMGLRMLLGRDRRKDTEYDVSTDKHYGVRPPAFATGLLTQLSNPKAMAFFTALLPQFVSTATNVTLQFVILGITSLAVELPVLMMYGFVADRGRDLVFKGRFASWPDRIAGGFLIGAGVSLAVARRP